MVIKDVPCYSTVVGVPGHVVAIYDPESGRTEKLPDPEAEMMSCLREELWQLEERVAAWRAGAPRRLTSPARPPRSPVAQPPAAALPPMVAPEVIHAVSFKLGEPLWRDRGQARDVGGGRPAGHRARRPWARPWRPWSAAYPEAGQELRLGTKESDFYYSLFVNDRLVLFSKRDTAHAQGRRRDLGPSAAGWRVAVRVRRYT